MKKFIFACSMLGMLAGSVHQVRAADPLIVPTLTALHILQYSSMAGGAVAGFGKLCELLSHKEGRYVSSFLIAAAISGVIVSCAAPFAQNLSAYKLVTAGNEYYAIGCVAALFAIGTSYVTQKLLRNYSYDINVLGKALVTIGGYVGAAGIAAAYVAYINNF